MKSRYHSSSPEGIRSAIPLFYPFKRHALDAAFERPTDENLAMNTPQEEQAPLSKTQRKQAMADLQGLGVELVELSTDRIKKIDIPDFLRDAVRAAQRMTRLDEARRRQMQYIGKLMRDVDPEPIREALALVRGESAGETAKLHRLERLRTEFLADEKVLHEIATLYPTADLQYLRSLRRSALKEREQNKPARCYRTIFQALKALETGIVEDEDGENDPDGE